MSRRATLRARPVESENSLGSRVRRYAQVGGAVGGQAARMAGARAARPQPRPREHAGELRAALGGLKGPLMKVAQLIATIPDALPAEYAAELAQLQSQRAADGPALRAPPHGGRARPGLAAALRRVRPRRRGRRLARPGPPGRRCQDGRDRRLQAAVPDMESAVEADLPQLRLIFALYQRYDPSINPDRDPRGDPGPPARGAGLRARGPAHGPLPPHAGAARRTSTCRRSCPSSRPAACSP